MPEPLPDEAAGLPAHPDRADDPCSPTEGRRWGGFVVVAVVVALFALMVVLHLSGVVGPGAH